MATAEANPRAQTSALSLAIFSVTLFLSAALLFWLEPMFAKMTFAGARRHHRCLDHLHAFLPGDAAGRLCLRECDYAARQSSGADVAVGVLALAPWRFLPFSFPANRVPPVEHNPVPWLLMILSLAVGLPFFVLSTIAPTLQKWFSGIGHHLSGDPYFLYAASNFGSMLGLLSYPILIEPRFRLAEQSRLWTYGYVVLVIFILLCAVAVWRAPLREQNTQEISDRARVESTPAPALNERLIWLALAFVPSSLMLGVTTVLTTEIPPIPMFWVLPLAVYLLSFILVFAKKPPLDHSQIAEKIPLLILAGIIPVLLKTDWPLFLEIVVNLATLFVVAVACHGELAKRRPSAEHLTGFYLWVALGGVLGGLFNGVIAPLIFNSVFEFPLALICAALLRQLMLPAAKRPRFNWLDAALPFAAGALAIILVRVVRRFGIEPGLTLHLIAFGPSLLLCLSFAKRPIRFALGFVALLAAGTIYTGVYRNILHTDRSFYGIYRIADDESGQYRILWDGRTLHGMQALAPDRTREPLAYYTHSGPAGQIFAAFAGSEQRKSVAVVGLGAGALACYAAPGDHFTFYEIDPLVERIARDPRYFTFLRDCGAEARVILGDARISLKNSPDHQYGMFVLDAFGADAIPIHLLTREAIQLYLSKLSDHGVLIFHISNRYLDLQRVLGNAASDAGLVAFVNFDTANLGAASCHHAG